MYWMLVKLSFSSKCIHTSAARGALPTIQQIAFRVREWVGKLSEWMSSPVTPTPCQSGPSLPLSSPQMEMAIQSGIAPKTVQGVALNRTWDRSSTKK